MAYRASELSPEQRTAIESLLGRRIFPNEAITVRAFESPDISLERRAEIVARFERYFADLDATREPAGPEESESAFEEAMRQTRPDFRTHR